jgi:hypothetical protein
VTRRWLALSACLVLLMSCSSPNAPTAGDRSRLGGENDDASEKGGKPKKALKKAKRIAERAARSGSGNSTEGVGSRAAGKPPSGSVESSEIVPAYARRSATVTDPPDDSTREGITPSYAEIIEASIEGLGEDFRMTLTLDGQVPQQMPNDKTHMIIAFGITGPNEDEGASFGAQCTDDGWQAYAGGRDDSGAFPGTFFVRGSQIEMTVPWDYIEGPRAFEWYAASNWFFEVPNKPHYRVDLAPSKDLAKFPQ